MFRHSYTIIGMILGAISGFAYYYFIGCSSGTCAITAKPLNITLYGAFLGGLLSDGFKIKKQKARNN